MWIASIDQYEMSPAEGWPTWCAKEIRKADFVLMVCTDTYLQRVYFEEEAGKGHGVLWEARLIQQELYNAGAVSRKFIPVLFNDGSTEHIPEQVGGASCFRVETAEGYEALYRLLTDQPPVQRPQLGKKRRLPKRQRKSRAEIETPPERGEQPEDYPEFSELFRRFRVEWAPVLAGEQTEGLAVADTIDWTLRSLAPEFRREWLGILERYQRDDRLPEHLPQDEENTIRQLRNFGLIKHDGRFLFTPTRSQRISPTATGRLLIALHRGAGWTTIEETARSIVEELSRIARDPAAIAQLDEIRQSGKSSSTEVSTRLRNLHLVTHKESFLPEEGLSTTSLGEYVLRAAGRTSLPPVRLGHPILKDRASAHQPRGISGSARQNRRSSRRGEPAPARGSAEETESLRPAQLTLEEKGRAVMRLLRRLEDLRTFDLDAARATVRAAGGKDISPEITDLKWRLANLSSSIIESLERTFGAGTIEYERYKRDFQFDRVVSEHCSQSSIPVWSLDDSLRSRLKEALGEAGVALEDIIDRPQQELTTASERRSSQ